MSARKTPPIMQDPVVTIGILREQVATLTRERDEARAALALAYPRALQAAAYEAREFRSDHPDAEARVDMMEHFERISDRILALTPDDIERIAEEHEYG